MGIRNLTDDQKALILLIDKERRVAAKSGNTTGKSFLEGAYGVYWMDAIGSQLDKETKEPQGALWILSAPLWDGIFNILWASALGHIRNAARRGYMMPGFYSERSITWYVREDWKIEAISPPKTVGQEQQHGAAGRHHRNMLITGDEAPGIEESRIRAMKGMASAQTNKLFLVGNPTEAVSAFRQEYDSGEFRTFTLSAMNHPNVRQRREIIPGAASHVDIDSKVKRWCENRGPYTPGVIEPDKSHHDFLYAMHPDVGTDREGSIADPLPYPLLIDSKQVLGHRDGEVCVFRPDGRFLSSVMGEFPLEAEGTLFSKADIDKSVAMWLKNSPYYHDEMGYPTRTYDVVGVDPAESGDDVIAAPIWISKDYITGETRKRVDRLATLSKGDGNHIKNQLIDKYKKTPEYVIDSIGHGAETAGMMEQYASDMKVIRFKSSYSEPSKQDEPPFANWRSAAYWRASRLLQAGLLEVPPDKLLEEELMVTKYIFSKEKLLIIPKDKIKEIIGRSPDRADAFVMGLFQHAVESQAGGEYAARGGRSLNVTNRQAPDDISFYLNHPNAKVVQL